MDDSVTLRCMDTYDLETVFRWRNDLRVRRHMFNADLINMTDHAAWFKKSSQDPRRYLLLASRNDVPFGFAQFYLSYGATVADWGFYVDPNGPKGQGFTLGKTVLSYGFNKLQLYRVTGKVLNSNIRSIKFHERMGFTSEGILKSPQLTEFGYQNVHLFSLLADKWKSHIKDITTINRTNDKNRD